jgi:hypothetical protein
VKVCHCRDFFLNGDNKVFFRCSSSHIFITSFWKIVRFLY